MSTAKPIEYLLREGSPTAGLNRKRKSGSLWQGMLLTVAIAAVAFALGSLPYLGFLSPMILAVFLGVMFHAFVGVPVACNEGVKFSLKKLLKIAIVFLGFQLSFAQLIAVGWQGLLVIGVTLSSTFLFCLWVGKKLGLDPRLTRLIAAGTSICGASAVVATNTVIRGKDEHVAYAISVVTLFGFLSMLLFPMAAHLMSLTPETFGFWAGTSIHETAQVIGAAFQGGQVSGEIGTVAKLARIMFLVPVILILGYSFNDRKDEQAGAAKTSRLPVPWFVVGFVVLVAMNSIWNLDPELQHQVKLGNKFLLTVALAAMGLQMNFSKLRKAGPRPLYLGALAWVFVSVVGLTMVMITS